MAGNIARLSGELSAAQTLTQRFGGSALNQRRNTALAEIDKAPFSLFHVKICLVAGIGFFTDAYDIFSITIAAEILRLVYPILQLQTAYIKMATFIGILFGQLLFGCLADILGRKRMYGVELIIMIVATFTQAISGSGPRINIVGILIFWRVIMGIGIGGDYPLSAIIPSEFAPTRIRGRLMATVFAFQGLGQLAASIVGLIIVIAMNEDDVTPLPPDRLDYAWRLLIGLGCIPASFILYFRLTIPETPRFTLDIDRRIRRAEQAIRNASVENDCHIYNDDAFDEPRFAAPRASVKDFIAHFSKLANFKILFGTAYSWFALDISFYILTLNYGPIMAKLSQIFNSSNPSNNAYLFLYNLCCFSVILTVVALIPGFITSFLLIDIWGRKPIQLMGFIILTILFWVMSFRYDHLIDSSTGTATSAFVALYFLANFFQNFGPNTTTFIIPGEVFPTRYRSTAHGISAACGKLGAIISQALYIVTLKIGNPVALEVLSFVMLTGVFSTLLISETKQRTLEELSNEDQTTFITGTHVHESMEMHHLLPTP